MMRKFLACLAWANLTALIWLGVFGGPALAAAEPEAGGSFKPTQETTVAQAEPRKSKRTQKAEKMSPTQSYPPPLAQPAPAPEEPRAGSAADKRRGRNDDNPPVTTIELPKKREAAPSGRRSGRKAKGVEAVSPAPAVQPGQVPAPAEAAPPSGRSSKKSRQRADKPGAVREAAPPPTLIAPPRAADDQRKKSGRTKDRSRPRSFDPAPDPNAAPMAVAPAPERAGSKSRNRRDSRTVAPTTVPYAAPTVAAPAPERAGSKSRNRRDSRTVAPTTVPYAAPAVAAPAPERAGSKSRNRRDARAVAPTTVPYTAPTVAAPAPERAGSKSRNRRDSRAVAPTPDPNAAPMVAAPAPERAGSRSKNRREPRSAAPAPLVAAALPTPPGPAVGLSPEEEMTRAYQAFDLAYTNSLGKTRKELDVLWGFPMQKMGDNGAEVAYGFRQKGLLNLPMPTGKSPSKKKKAYYASSSIDPTLPGQYFTCLVVLWVDKQGRGVVVDGEAVGDCFIAETLSRPPDHFER